MEAAPRGGGGDEQQQPVDADAANRRLSMEAMESLLAQAEALTAPDPGTTVFARVSSMSHKGSESGGAGGSEQTPEEREAMAAAKERGNRLFSAQQYGEAATAYTEALRSARAPEEVATLLSNRSAAYASLSRMYRSRPARRSECAALFDLDPTSLAHMAAKDADKAVGLRPSWARAYSRQGAALFLLERFEAAREAYLEGLALEPTNAPLQEGLREVQALLSGDADAAAAPHPAPTSASTPASTPGAGPSSPPGAPAPASALAAASKRQRTMGAGAGRSALDDWDCGLCAKLLFEPVTTPCGHTFCKECFGRAMDHKPRCPYCRAVLHVSRDSLPVTVTLASIIARAFPEECEERRREAAGLGGGEADAASPHAPLQPSAPAGPPVLSMPLFVMSLLLPGEAMALNIFEPRYRLMIRRVMEGSRRFGLGQARRDQQEIEDVAVEVEILDCQAQPDGRYYLEIVGRRRVRILSHSELDGYRVARCEVLQDTEPQPGTPAHAALPDLAAQVERQVDSMLAQLRPLASGAGRLSGRIRSMLEGIGERPPLAQADRFSLWAAAVAVSLCPELDKAALLRCTDTAQRLRQLQERMAARMAGGNQGCTLM